MIKEVLFCPNHARRIRAVGVASNNPVSFSEGYNVIVGPNGSGKTTILEAISYCKDCQIKTLEKTAVKYISLESLLNPVESWMGPVEKTIMEVRQIFSSEGEAVREKLSIQRYSGENCILIDSPEIGQDLGQSIELYENFRRLIKDRGVQFIVATHNPIFIRDADKIIETERGYLEKLKERSKNFLGEFYK